MTDNLQEEEDEDNKNNEEADAGTDTGTTTATRTVIDRNTGRSTDRDAGKVRTETQLVKL